jgi:hypothetical protein
MLFREIISVYCENHTEHINTLCGKNIEPFIVEADGTYGYHCALKRLECSRMLHYSSDTLRTIMAVTEEYCFVWVCRLIFLQKVTNVSEESAVSIFRVEESLLFFPEDGGTGFYEIL